MTNQLTPLQCPGCGGLLRSLDARVWQCAYCESRYVLLGEETPVPGLARVVDGNKASLYSFDGTSPDDWECRGPVSELEAAKRKARMAINSFNRTVGRRPLFIGEVGPEIVRLNPRLRPKPQPMQPLLR